jgi:hypothetical protein
MFITCLSSFYIKDDIGVHPMYFIIVNQFSYTIKFSTFIRLNLLFVAFLDHDLDMFCFDSKNLP